MHTMLYQGTTDVCLGPKLFIRISGATLNHTKNVFDNRAVVHYAESPHITCDRYINRDKYNGQSPDKIQP